MTRPVELAPALPGSNPGWRRRHVFAALGLRAPRTERTAAEAQLLREVAAGRRCIVELGVAEGGSALDLRRAMAPDGCLVLVDRYATGRTRMSFARIVARRVVAASDNGRVAWLRQSSDEAARTWSGTIDLLHVDADHEFEQVRRDWMTWHRHVPVGGAVAFHDSAVFAGGWTTPEWGPVRLVEEIVVQRPDWRLAARSDSLSVLRRVA